MNSSTHDNDQSSQVINQTIYPHEKSIQHQQHISQHREEHEESEPKYYVQEHYYNIPCNCEMSLPGRIFQSFISGIKMSIEFVLFMNYIIERRNVLLECHYPFDRHQSCNCQVNHNYPFVRRSTYTSEMKKLNAIRI